MGGGGRGGALARRGRWAVNAALEKAGVRLVATDALALRLASVVGHEPLPFPAAGVGDGVVALRPLREADASVLRRYTEDPPAEWLAVQRTLHEAGLGLDLAVVERASGAMVGLLQLQRFDWPNHRASVGLWLLPEARGQGVMTRALIQLVGWVFSESILDRIEYLAEAANEPSIRLAERCGFVREGELRACLVRDRRRHDAVLLAALRDEWRPPDGATPPPAEGEE